MTTWGELQIGDVIEDKNGKQWTVHDVTINSPPEQAEANLQITDGTRYVIIIQSASDEAPAVSQVPGTLLDVVTDVIAEDDGTPAEGGVYRNVSGGLKLRSHLYLVHKHHGAAQLTNSIDMNVRHDQLHTEDLPIAHTHQ
jgi:hypothetical protein